MANRINWLEYDFSVNSPSASWNSVPGIYIFTGLNQADRWVPLYIGQASSLAVRLANHERWLEASQLGATHIHAKTVKDDWNRDQIEQELIRAYQPRLNVQLR